MMTNGNVTGGAITEFIALNIDWIIPSIVAIIMAIIAFLGYRRVKNLKQLPYFSIKQSYKEIMKKEPDNFGGTLVGTKSGVFLLLKNMGDPLSNTIRKYKTSINPKEKVFSHPKLKTDFLSGEEAFCWLYVLAQDKDLENTNRIIWKMEYENNEHHKFCTCRTFTKDESGWKPSTPNYWVKKPIKSGRFCKECNSNCLFENFS